MSEKLYFVWGGVFTDTSFRQLQPGAEECYGPFHTEAEADRAWSEHTRKMVDVAQHRLYVLQVARPGGSDSSFSVEKEAKRL
jgi:hypothetical protein